MNKLFLPIIFLSIILFSCNESLRVEDNISNALSLEGNITGLPDSTAVVLMKGVDTLDISYSKAGSFQLNAKIGDVPESLALMLTKDSTYQEYVLLFAANDKIKLSGNINMPGDEFTLSGSLHQDLENTLYQKLKPYMEQRNKHLEKMFALRGEGKWNNELQEEYWGNGEASNGLIGEIDRKTDSIEQVFVRENINTFTGLFHLSYALSDYSKKEKEELYESITNDKVKNSKYGKILLYSIDAKELKKGEMYINFTANDIEGKKLEFKNLFKNKYVLLDFSTKHCGWCQKAKPILNDIYSEKNKELEIVTFYVDDDKDGFKDFSKDKGWRSVMDGEGRFSKTYISYKGGITPSFFLFNKKGELVEKWEGLSPNFKEELVKIIHL